MPIVCYYDSEKDLYIIVDGFHCYPIMLDYQDIYGREGGKLPVSVIDKPCLLYTSYGQRLAVWRFTDAAAASRTSL